MTATTCGDYLGRLRFPSGESPAAAFEPRSRGPNPGVTVLIPTYTSADGDRAASLRQCLGSVLAEGRDGHLPIAFVLVDNGLSPSAARQAGELLRRSGCPHFIVRAAPAPGRRYTAAEARNAGLATLAGLPASSGLRQRYLLFLDDDTALGPRTLTRLMATLRAEEPAIAACPRVLPVTDLAAWRAAGATAPPGVGEPPRTRARRLPGPLTGDGYDLLSVTAYGSLVTGRAVGLLVRQDPLLRWIGRHGPLFYAGTPYGSSEDMLAMATLSRLGQLWSVPAATVADEVRKSPGATRRQQFAWGYDHAWLARRLAEAGLLRPGVHALTWTARPAGATAGWELSHADWGGPVGFLINPRELRFGHRLLRAASSAPEVAAQLFGGHAAAVAAGTAQLGRVLGRWGGVQDAAHRQPRPDLPRLGDRDWSSLRDGLDALVGHLAGNVAGSRDNGADPAAVPPFFLYGARQPAASPRRDGRRHGEPVSPPEPMPLNVAS